MMDLVGRLKGRADHINREGYGATADLMREAASEIERLAAVQAPGDGRLRALVAKWRENHNPNISRNDGTCTDCSDTCCRANELEAALAAGRIPSAAPGRTTP